MRHQSKWRAKSVGSSTTDPWIFSSDPMTEEEVKGKEDSSSQSESFSTVGGMMSTLKKLST
jgi:hypothetical protein